MTESCNHPRTAQWRSGYEVHNECLDCDLKWLTAIARPPEFVEPPEREVEDVEIEGETL